MRLSFAAVACSLLVCLSSCDDGEDEPEVGSPDGASSPETDAGRTATEDASSDASTVDAESEPPGDPERVLAFLDIVAGSVNLLRLDDGDSPEPEAIVTGMLTLQDGIAIDVENEHIYWTNMGVPNADDGSIKRVGFEGGEVTDIVPMGGTFTPKQMHLDSENGKIYWSDREGMRVMRANLDGSEIETLVTTGEGAEARADATTWCVGIAVDTGEGHVYWTQKGPDNGNAGVIKRAGLEIPDGETSSDRSDIETLFEDLPEPIDLALDLERRVIYWADRGDNTISRAPMDDPDAEDREILVTGLGEAIGVALDLPHGKLYFTALDGTLGEADIDGGEARVIHKMGGLTGIALADMNAQ